MTLKFRWTERNLIDRKKKCAELSGISQLDACWCLTRDETFSTLV